MNWTQEEDQWIRDRVNEGMTRVEMVSAWPERFRRHPEGHILSRYRSATSYLKRRWTADEDLFLVNATNAAEAWRAAGMPSVDAGTLSMRRNYLLGQPQPVASPIELSFEDKILAVLGRIAVALESIVPVQRKLL